MQCYVSSGLWNHLLPQKLAQRRPSGRESLVELEGWDSGVEITANAVSDPAFRFQKPKIGQAAYYLHIAQYLAVLVPP
jgi:hypothetical protein